MCLSAIVKPFHCMQNRIIGITKQYLQSIYGVQTN